MKRQWRLADKNNHYYHQSHNGLVIGHAYNVVHTIIWAAKIPINAVEELILGQYVELEYAKRAIEEYWEKDDKTFEAVHEHLLSRS
jgi:hypothetical protein